MIDENNYISRLKHHDESALEYIVRKYGNLYKSEIYRILQEREQERRQRKSRKVELSL